MKKSIVNLLFSSLFFTYLFSGYIQKTSYTSGVAPVVSVKKINSGTVKKYEKLEITLDLENVVIHNPYNPDEIDVYAEFTSPSGKKLRVNGFYDDYNHADAWKIRFSTGETGEWSCRVFVKNNGGIGQSDLVSFKVVDSDHHGWIRVSKTDPHYFSYDDGTSWYAVAVYSPWGNNEKRFKTYADHKANLMGLWDINYGGFVDSTGLIEEELGKYNQEKCGRIDSLLGILESDHIKLMFCIWPHDLFSKTVWERRWNINPLNKIVSVTDVYSDSLAWKYQERKYRYLIARFGYSRSLGIWELINEMNGTDGWAAGRHREAYDWVAKAHQYFSENDPYHHPLTASFSGGYNEFRSPLYERTDVPNIHLYEAQEWPLKYPDDTLRSCLYNYAWAAQRFWNEFNKPAIFGEAGADLTYYKPANIKYHDAYHNALWATLTNGLAGTPVWWDFTFLSERDWNNLEYLSVFVKDINFANLVYHPAEIKGEGIDAYGMFTLNGAFGWACSYADPDISNKKLEISIPSGNYKVRWFDTWTGQYISEENIASINGKMTVSIPKLQTERKDIAFKIKTVAKK